MMSLYCTAGPFWSAVQCILRRWWEMDRRSNSCMVSTRFCFRTNCHVDRPAWPYRYQSRIQRERGIGSGPQFNYM